LGLAFKLVLGRAPNALEKQKLTSALDFYRQHFASNEDAALKLIKQGESKADASVPKAELASWTTICSLILNLDEALTKE
jgi:hypothetical protein